MDQVFDRVLDELESTFRHLEERAPRPVKEDYKDGFVLRYVEKTPQQAMLQKFARQISGLHTIRLLLANGFLQEMGVIQRTLDDFEEDILFMALAIANDDWTEHHSNYLEYHWMEESAEGAGNRGQVPRKNIRAFVAKYSGADPSSMISAGRRVYKGYSGFVHGSGEAIIDMCVNDPPAYLISGMLHSPLYPDHADDIWNYMYRGLVSATSMARIFSDENLAKDRYLALKAFEFEHPDRIF